ncbi:MAG: riboflavin kinase [Bacteroides sp.]|jgi:riboflavin kinase/FMN adenylyltransferase|nr:riboflavin kinase [Bacteroides sp.]
MENIADKNKNNTVRMLVEQGAVLEAGQLLGHAFFLEGFVVEGNRIGRTLGYPTANLGRLDESQTTPAQGVYVALVKAVDRWHESMVNIGIRPTLDLDHVTIEAHLFDFDEDLYGQKISIHFLERIRDEMRFPSLGDLKDQLRKDRTTSLQILGELAFQPQPDEERVIIKKIPSETK